MEITLGQQHNVGEKPTVILYTYINRHTGTQKNINNRPETMEYTIILHGSSNILRL